MPTTFTASELSDISRIVGAVPPGTSPAVAIRFAARKHHISESALTSALASIKSGNAPTVTEAAAAPTAGSPLYEAAQELMATVNRAEVDLSKATTADLYATIGARFG
jgi:hypothetical protein